MKEKNKKILKTLGVGAVATLGVFAMTGCSISDDEKTKLMDSLENANTYMEKTINLLQNQNEELKDQNEKLEDYITEIKNENAKITNEEAWNKVKLAVAQFKTNYNGVRDNLRIETDNYKVGNAEYQKVMQEFYTTESGEYVSFFEMTNTVTDIIDYGSELNYKDDGKIYRYTVDNDGVTVEKEKTIVDIHHSVESASSVEYQLRSFIFFYEECLSADNVVSVEVLENGNYKITLSFVKIQQSEENEPDEYYDEQHYILQYEINTENNFEFCKINFSWDESSKDSQGNEDFDFNTIKVETKFDYNVVTKEHIEELLIEAKAAELTPAE